LEADVELGMAIRRLKALHFIVVDKPAYESWFSPDIVVILVEEPVRVIAIILTIRYIRYPMTLLLVVSLFLTRNAIVFRRVLSDDRSKVFVKHLSIIVSTFLWLRSLEVVSTRGWCSRGENPTLKNLPYQSRVGSRDILTGLL
jgi:hypothetical protein